MIIRGCHCLKHLTRKEHAKFLCGFGTECLNVFEICLGGLPLHLGKIERSFGVRTDYLRDALGSVTATKRTDRGTISNTYRYKPYRERLAKTG